MRKKAAYIWFLALLGALPVAKAHFTWETNELVLARGESGVVRIYSHDPTRYTYDIKIGGECAAAKIIDVRPLGKAGNQTNVFESPFKDGHWFLHGEWSPPPLVHVDGYHWEITIKGLKEGQCEFDTDAYGDYPPSDFLLVRVRDTTPPGPDYYTEHFFLDIDTFDLSNKALLFTPNGDVSFYSACIQEIAQLPTDPTGGIRLQLGDDSDQLIELHDQKSVSVFGSSFSHFYVSSNGYITFTEVARDPSESLSDHFDTEGISCLFDDLNPSAGGMVSWKQLADRVVVTWENVPEYGTTNSNTFQVEMYFDGRIQLAWLAIAVQDGIVGLSDGLGVPPDFQETDLSEYPQCQPFPTGSIVAWGRDISGEIDVPMGNDFVAISASRHYGLALRSDGSIVGWGENKYGQAIPPEGNDFAAIAAGVFHAIALKADGSIVGWGDNYYGQASPPGGNDFVAIAAGTDFGIALRRDGSIIGWGYDPDGRATPPKGNDFVAIAAGRRHGLALKSDGSIVGWGENKYGQASPPEGNDFVAITAGGQHSLALKSDGSIVGWGDNGYGQARPPEGNDFLAISAGTWHSLALKSNGTVVGWGRDAYGEATPPAGSDLVAIAAGHYFSLAIEATARFSTLSEALDTTLSFTRGGSTNWFYQTATSYYDGDAAQSGGISHNQESWMQTTVSVPAVGQGFALVFFYWKVSSEVSYDWLEFYIDGVLQDRISGSLDWQRNGYTITGSGSHTLEWRYVKDGTIDDGWDCGWVDWMQVIYPL